MDMHETLIARLLQCLKISTLSGFVSGRGQISPLPGLGRPQARLLHDLEQPSGGSSIDKCRHEGLNHILERLTLGKPGGDKGRQGPKRLCLRVTTPTSCQTIQLRLDMALELVKQGLIVLGCSQ